ncbi:MAG: 2-oxoglutarate dehydrogenase E1 subunit family protein, partial [Anaerolineales bacterium]
MDLWREFHGPNAGYVLDLFERYRRDPASVDEATRAAFAAWTPSADGQSATAPVAVEKIVGAAKLARALRGYGHLAARLDPLGTQPPGDPALELATYGLTEDDLQQFPSSIIGGPTATQTANALEAMRALRQVYCGVIGYDNDHIHIPAERDWLRHAAESRRFHPDNQPANPSGLLDRLTQVEAFERFLQRAFPGKTRFSIEGVDLLVPMLDEMIGCAADEGTRHILIGMAHRGRLNVLAHILNKPYAQILAEFKDPARPRSRADDELGWTGDVKYHSGARRAVHESRTVDLVISLPPNPSHLVAVYPVIVGMARAAATRASLAGVREPPRGSPTAGYAR